MRRKQQRGPVFCDKLYCPKGNHEIHMRKYDILHEIFHMYSISFSRYIFKLYLGILDSLWDSVQCTVHCTVCTVNDYFANFEPKM